MSLIKSLLVYFRTAKWLILKCRQKHVHTVERYSSTYSLNNLIVHVSYGCWTKKIFTYLHASATEMFPLFVCLFLSCRSCGKTLRISDVVLLAVRIPHSTSALYAIMVQRKSTVKYLPHITINIVHIVNKIHV